MSGQPEISVITATYNNGLYLAQAIESILSQTITDFEYIIIDDASTDETPEIISRYSKRDARIMPVRNSSRRGRSNSRNQALNMAHGRWIAIFDGDDISHPQRFERQLTFLMNNPEIDYVGTACHAVNKLTGAEVADRIGELPLTNGAIRWRLCFRYPFHHSSTLGRYQSFVSAGAYPPEYPVCEDIYLWMSMARQQAKFGNINEPLLTYRVDPDAQHYALNQIIAKQLHRQHISEILACPISEDAFDAIWWTNNLGFQTKLHSKPKDLIAAIHSLLALEETFRTQGVLTTDDQEEVRADLLMRSRGLATQEHASTQAVYAYGYSY